MFRHKPLPREPPHIRLVRFRQSETVDGAVADPGPDIRLDIKHETLERPIGSYVALSYVWGDAKENPGDIELDGSQFQIGRNLYDALLVLRSNEQTCRSWIWVDSICIHQSDVAEKTAQVALMGDIFHQAFMVCSWLGTSSSEIDMAMDCISDLGTCALDAGVLQPQALEMVLASEAFWNDHDSLIGTFDEGQGEIDPAKRLCVALLEFPNKFEIDDVDLQKSIAQGIRALLLKDCWHRVWIIQEVALNNNVLLFCGNKFLPINTFEALLYSRELMRRASARYSIHLDTMSGIFDSITGNSGDITALNVRRNRHHGSPVSVVTLLKRVDIGPGRPHYSATDPRDIVFGLLGIISNQEQLELRADCTQTTSQVLTTLTRALLERDEDRYFLLDDVVPRSMHDSNHLRLPSWVPDWLKIGSGKTGNDAWAMNHSGIFDATAGRQHGSRHLSASQQATQDPAALTRRGCYVDTVTEVMSPPQYQCPEWSASFVRDAPAWLSRVAEFARLSPTTGPGDDHVWRTLLKRLQLPIPKKIESTGDSSRAWVYRHIMRQICPRPQDMPESVVNDLLRGLYSYPGLDSEIKSNSDRILEFLMTDLPKMAGAYNRGRTLFKTEKGHVWSWSQFHPAG